MMALDPTRIVADPFPYFAAPQCLEPALFSQLREQYPVLQPHPEWNRMTADLIRGDVGYDKLLQRSPAWKRLHDFAHSQAFVDALLGAFTPHLAAAGCLIDSKQAKYVDFTEGRTPLHRRSESKQRELAALGSQAVFVRMDLGIGEVGYRRAAHIDWRHRIASVLVYFDDADDQEMVGGDFHVLRRQGDTFQEVACFRPKTNLGLIKLDSNASFHSVDEIRQTNSIRRTVYIAVSGYRSVWPLAA